MFFQLVEFPSLVHRFCVTSDLYSYPVVLLRWCLLCLLSTLANVFHISASSSLFYLPFFFSFVQSSELICYGQKEVMVKNWRFESSFLKVSEMGVWRCMAIIVLVSVFLGRHFWCLFFCFVRNFFFLFRWNNLFNGNLGA